MQRKIATTIGESEAGGFLRFVDAAKDMQERSTRFVKNHPVTGTAVAAAPA